MTGSMVVYSLTAGAAIFVAVLIGLKGRFTAGEIEARMSGVWTNRTHSMRVLIYSLNATVLGDIIWTQDGNSRMLGSAIIRDIRPSFFGWSKGTYIDPVTLHRFSFRLKIKKDGLLSLRVFESAGDVRHEEDWTLMS